MRRALLLRAQEDALRTAERLRSRGFETIISPVLDIVATGAQIPRGHYDAVIASSAKGVELAQGIDDRMRSMMFHAVGGKTANAARALGWRPDIVAGAAETILPLLRARYGAPAHFLYLAGRDRQPTLEAGLQTAGHRLTIVEVYAAEAATALTPEAQRALEAGAADAILHYSRRSAEIFIRLADAAGLGDRLTMTTHLALSENVAAPLRARGLSPLVAEAPDEDGLLRLLDAR